MSKVKKLVKWSLIIVAGSMVVLAGFGWWFMSLLSPPNLSLANLKNTVADSLPYLVDNPVQKRGKILAVVTSTAHFPTSGKKTGYELTELSQAYTVFVANGFEVDIASPQGGEAPIVLDDEDMGAYDYAFLNDPLVQRKLKNTLVMDSVQIGEYEAIYFVGGKGTMFDFPDNEAIQKAVNFCHEEGKVIGAVCHGPAALLNVKLAEGTSYLEGKKLCSFTNREELFLIKDARVVFPYLLQDQLIENGALFTEGPMYLENVIIDGHLVTGQNPWSTWALAEAMVKQLGYEPKTRQKSAAENTVMVLNAYEKEGLVRAKHLIEELKKGETELISRDLIAMHILVAAMQGEVSKGFEMIGLLRHAKSLSE